MNAETTLFYGPEKRLDIFLFSPQSDLPARPDSQWKRVTRASKSRIVSKISSQHLSAYILSESSLFIWPNRVLMMTCGQTTLPKALPEILHIVGKRNVSRVFYERKKFFYPRQQPSTFEDDVACIRGFFPGKSSRFGPATDDHVHLFYSSHAKEPAKREATLQLLMHDLPSALLGIFSSTNGVSGKMAAKRSGLDTIYPHMFTDSHLFRPCGFSMNGILATNYFTIHVTPQPARSYASFETNFVDSDYSGKVKQIVSIFKPGKFSLVLKTSMDNHCLPLHPTVNVGLQGYNATESHLYELDCGYVVTFVSYITNSR